PATSVARQRSRYDCPATREDTGMAKLQEPVPVAVRNTSAAAAKALPFHHSPELTDFRLTSTFARPERESLAVPSAPGLPSHVARLPGVVLVLEGAVRSTSTLAKALRVFPTASSRETETGWVCS